MADIQLRANVMLLEETVKINETFEDSHGGNLEVYGTAQLPFP